MMILVELRLGDSSPEVERNLQADETTKNLRNVGITKVRASMGLAIKIQKFHQNSRCLYFSMLTYDRYKSTSALRYMTISSVIGREGEKSTHFDPFEARPRSGCSRVHGLHRLSVHRL
jgi:hypothetical protein